MLNLTWKFLTNQSATTGLNKIWNCDGMDPITSYRAGRIANSVQKELQKAHQTNMDLIEKHAKKDEKGVVLPPKNGNFSFDEGKEELYTKEMAALADNTFEVKAHKLHISRLSGCKLTPAELIALEDILEGEGINDEAVA